MVAVLCFVSPVPAVASGWSTQSVPMSWAPGGVSCTARSACVLVGGRSGPSRRGLTLAARWDGRRWIQQHTPSPAGGGSLGAVSCSSRSACMAVGCCSGGHPLAERWNGREWSMLRVPSRAGLNAVSCTSPSACTAVGSAIGLLLQPGVRVERWDGRSWAAQPAPSPAWADRTVFDSVSCVSVTLCTAVGVSVGGQFDEATRALVERWDGRRWAIDRVPRPPNSYTREQLNSVVCTSATVCTAVGDADGAALIERWNDSRWSIQPTPNEAPAPLTSVSCVSATICEAVGTADQDAQGSTAPPPEMVAERWNGRRWSLQHVPHSPGPSWLNAVACPSARSCFAWGAVSGTPVFERYS